MNIRGEIDELAEKVARAFHEAYERLAPEHGYETRKASAVPWDQVPDNNRRLMTSVAKSLLVNGVVHVPNVTEDAPAVVSPTPSDTTVAGVDSTDAATGVSVDPAPVDEVPAGTAVTDVPAS